MRKRREINHPSFSLRFLEFRRSEFIEQRVKVYLLDEGYTCNTPKYTIVIFDMFRVFRKHNLNVS